MIRLILANILMFAAYLYGAEHNRCICLALWFIFPILNLLIWSRIEKKSY